ncbi:MAG TPA: proteasome activator [Actinomycetota bacterium]|nr:proteasome activator [Actinomycetota bacterium]
MSDPEQTAGPAQPPVVPAVPVGGETAGGGDGAGAGPQQESVAEPAKLLRIASMVRELLEETRQAPMDESGRKRLASVYSRSLGELGEAISPDLREELEQLAPPMEGVPSESELRIAQAQLVGWLEGLFHGIQAAMFAQQAAARAQFEELRRRGLMAQNPQPGEGQPPQRGGQYL